MNRAWRCSVARIALTLALSAGAAGLTAGAFKYSNAPVEDSPGMTKRETAILWPHVSLEEAKKELGRPGVLFIDGRTHQEWKQAHIPGALSLPGLDFDNYYPMMKDSLRKAKALIVYCHGHSCGAADAICQNLADHGLRNMAVFSGGFPEWNKAGLAKEDENGKVVASSAPAAPKNLKSQENR